MSTRPAMVAAAIAAVLLGSSALARQSVWGNFTSTAPSAGNSITAAADFRAPTASASAIGKSTGGAPGSIKKGGTYYVYANVSDSGNPASGVASVTADLSAVTPGSTAVVLSAGSFSAGGVTYNRRSAALAAEAGLAAGSYGYALTSTDTAGNSRTQSTFTVAVDNTGPSGSSVQTTNGGTATGLAEAGDKLTLAYSEALDPNSILSGWTGAATGVVVRLNNGSGASNDTVTVYNASNAAQLPLGTVNLGRTDYTSANITFGASGTASSMAMSGSSIAITLGTQSAAATAAAGTGSMSWTPSSTVTDPAGNNASPTVVTESGTADKEF